MIFRDLRSASGLAQLGCTVNLVYSLIFFHMM
jgi:hypothetical protein